MHTLARMCEEAGVRFSLRTLPDRALPNPEIEHLAKNLYADRPRRFAGAPRRVQAVQARDPYMEAERAAGYLFEKCRLEGWRYRDMAIVCADMGVYGPRPRTIRRRSTCWRRWRAQRATTGRRTCCARSRAGTRA